MPNNIQTERTIGLIGATGVGVGAIVGGGILALAGVAFATTGPSAIVAFALNGFIALLTALTFAELSSSFPESGGTYTFAKKVLTVESAFAVGWVVWFASIVAAVLYAQGFGYFFALIVADLLQAAGREAPAWLTGRWSVAALAMLATFGYTVMLTRTAGDGGQWINIGKVAVFGVLIAGGLWVVTSRSPKSLGESLTPFFAEGGPGLIQAMGFTFVALQGFDLIAAVAGEVKRPERVIPRAMLLSLGIALAIYLPLLFVWSTVGVGEGESITDASRADPEAIVARAAENYLGEFGYWFVLIAAVLSMLSALQANLFAASRVGRTMACDRTLPRRMSILSRRWKTPVVSITVTSGIVVAIILIVPDVAAAGAAASLIFLITFTLAHWITVLARRRRGERQPPFRTPLFPLVPAIGGVACLALAVFQGLAVPLAGAIAGVWLLLGGLLFLALFARSARVVDASSAARDPELVRLRGRSPLVLVPIANPANAHSMVEIANALATPEVGRVLLLFVVVPPEKWQPSQDTEPLARAQAVLGESIRASVAAGLFPEALTTIAVDPWREINRVSGTLRCESLLLGLSELTDDSQQTPLDELMGTVDSDVVVLRAPPAWELTSVDRILVPIGGRGENDQLRARLLGSLQRMGHREINYMQVLPKQSTASECRRANRRLQEIAADDGAESADTTVLQSDSATESVIQQAGTSDLVILGAQRHSRREKAFGHFIDSVARGTACPLILISRRG